MTTAAQDDGDYTPLLQVTFTLERPSNGTVIPAILHPNEAVIPLSKGGSIPVDLT